MVKGYRRGGRAQVCDRAIGTHNNRISWEINVEVVEHRFAIEQLERRSEVMHRATPVGGRAQVCDRAIGTFSYTWH